ncbi:MAG: hypothetical protein FWE02_02950 [Defluviitaleaceae bacterium]|nr:hypothetical protein [Defluviitaleaceae bacterium]
MLIAVCGIDGSGKSSCIEYAKSYFEATKKEVVQIDPMKNGSIMPQLKNFTKMKGEEWYNHSFDKTVTNVCYALDALFFLSELKVSSHDKIILSHRYDICCKELSLM